MSADKKEIVNTLYHSGVESLLTIGYAEIGKKVFKRPVPKVDLNMSDIGMLTLYMLAVMTAKDFLVKQGIIPADILK